MFITTLALTVNLFASAARVSVVAGRPNNPPKASDFTWLKVDGLCVSVQLHHDHCRLFNFYDFYK